MSLEPSVAKKSVNKKPVTWCKKCLVKLDYHNHVTAHGMGDYGVIGEIIADNNCPAGGGHDFHNWPKQTQSQPSFVYFYII